MEQQFNQLIDTNNDRAIICPLERGTGIYKAINKVMRSITAIAKDKRNQQQNFNYRGIDDVMNALKPLFDDAGVFIAPEVLSSVREERQTKSGGNLIYTILRVRYWFFAEDGSFVTAVVQGEGMDSADKSSNKAEAIAMKYACFQVLCIPTEEMAQADPDGHSPEESKPRQTAQNSTKKEAEKQGDANPPEQQNKGQESKGKGKSGDSEQGEKINEQQVKDFYKIAAGKNAAVKAILTEYGVTKPQEIPAANYDEICEKVKEIKKG